MLRTHISLYSNKKQQINCVSPFPDNFSYINTVWDRFNKIFGSIGDILRYLPIFLDYHQRLLEELYDDKVIYAEIRSSLNGVYDENNRSYTPIETAKMLENLVINFRKTHSNFIGVKFIYAVSRKQTKEQMQEKIDIFKELL